MLVLFNIYWAILGMQTLFNDVFDNYFSTRIKLGGKANFIASPDQNALLKHIPVLIENLLKSVGKDYHYKIKGSIGNGNIARVPWVGIFRKDITTNAENGYYIVLLFSEDMSCCYLSLNQGITAVEKLYTKRFALKKMREASNQALTYLDCDPDVWRGAIDLRASADLGRAYEAAAIASYRYDRTAIPTVEGFFKDLITLIAHYDRLWHLFGKNLHSLFTVSESEYQKVVLEKAAQPGELALDEPVGQPWQETNAGALGITGYSRSPIVAARAIRAAEFSCEIDPTHKTFISRAKRNQYVEAHHLIPMSQQGLFQTSLDVVENVVALCATCHRMLHFGMDSDRKDILISLLNKRKHKLIANSIDVKSTDFLKYYSSSAILEE
jgi:5-methylcytosine-specific restriction protein A